MILILVWFSSLGFPDLLIDRRPPIDISIHCKILLALPSKYTENLNSSHYLHLYWTGRLFSYRRPSNNSLLSPFFLAPSSHQFFSIQQAEWLLKPQLVMTCQCWIPSNNLHFRENPKNPYMALWGSSCFQSQWPFCPALSISPVNHATPVILSCH